MKKRHTDGVRNLLADFLFQHHAGTILLIIGQIFLVVITPASCPYAFLITPTGNLGVGTAAPRAQRCGHNTVAAILCRIFAKYIVKEGNRARRC